MIEIGLGHVVIHFTHFRSLLIGGAVHWRLSDPGPHRRNKDNATLYY